MNLRDLEYVVAIERYRNFGKAAQACHVSQPALSSQVKKLEEQLGVELFVRTNQSVCPTEAGLRIVATAKDMQRAARQINDMAAEYRDPLSVPLKVGIFPTLAPFIVPYITRSVNDAADSLKLIYRERPTAELIQELRSRTIDVALVSGPLEVAGCKFTPVFREKLYLLVSDKHRLSNRHTISAREVPREEMLLLDEEHCLRNEAIALCQDNRVGMDVPEDMSATSLLTASHYITNDFGCTLMPELGVPFIARANPHIRFIEINDESYARNIGFLSRKGCPREHILHALCDQIRSHPPDDTQALH
ncbi:MAG: LysR substrate-binding domain-containing protein [Pseudomonadota bacterium]